jgi:spore coat polysaccharide biosynthesis protein SpsF
MELRAAMTINAIIQARMGSTRLPGKVLLKVCGKTMLEHLLDRLKRSRGLSAIVVATSTAPQDNAIEAEVQRLKVPCFRGSEDDVLARYAGAAQKFPADAYVRITADCPLFDAQLLDRMIDRFLEGGCDYLSNTLERTYPRGLDAEILTKPALEEANARAAKAYEREHVTPYIIEHSERFRRVSFKGEKDLSHHRWTLDTAEDLQLIRAVYEGLYPRDPNFSTEDVLKLLAERPELAKLNAHIEQKKVQ